MNNITKKYQLVITGNITPDELKKAQEYFAYENIKVVRGFTKTIEPLEIIQIIFRDFDAYAFLRDGILFSFLSKIANKIFLWFKKNIESKRRPKVFWVMAIFEKDNELKLSVNLHLPEDKNIVQSLLEELKKKFPIEYINKIKNWEMWDISYDFKNKKIRVVKL
ncbi:MAG: hypothetical protein PHO28_03230 [Candidatus Pacebacteria bacterium]|nr:hypothetical protein [Candidatus Paceibacterota bacterium]